MAAEIAVKLDLNNPIFLKTFLSLEKQQKLAVLGTLQKLFGMTWNQVYADAGLKWEVLYSVVGPEGERVYSLRMGKAFRALAVRKSDYMRFISLHPDHDSAYHH